MRSGTVSIQFVRTDKAKDLYVPEYMTSGAVGMDLCAVETVLVRAFSIARVPSGIKVKVPEGYEAQIRSRSGLSSKHGVWVVNQPATIDQDFVGELIIPMYNAGPANYKINRGDRIAQMVICPVIIAVMEEVESLPETDRGERGFGSTGSGCK